MATIPNSLYKLNKDTVYQDEDLHNKTKAADSSESVLSRVLIPTSPGLAHYESTLDLPD